jgi:hypothetical protein
MSPPCTGEIGRPPRSKRPVRRPSASAIGLFSGASVQRAIYRRGPAGARPGALPEGTKPSGDLGLSCCYGQEFATARSPDALPSRPTALPV